MSGCINALRNPYGDSHYIDDYYFYSEIYPKLSGRGNIIITAETTMDCFEKYCLDNHVDAFNKRSIDAVVAVAMAAKMGNVSLIESLVQRIGPEILNTYDRNYFTPIHIVCQETRVENGIYNIKQLCRGVKKLIDLGADPNITSSQCYTPLSASALKTENILLTHLLIQNHGKLPASCMSHLRDHAVFIKTGSNLAESIIKKNINEVFIKQYNNKEECLNIYNNIFF
ncbi:MAG: hypothetical protein Q8L98_05465 [Chlamydiales bacterium]|nr:hypothetical protein [Chlamydiales bacterium]